MRDIGKNIKALREKKGMTQEALAEALFVTRQTVSNYENGRSRPDLDMLVKIADVLDADVNQVLYGLPADQDRRRTVIRLGVGCLILLVLEVVLFLPALAEGIVQTVEYVTGQQGLFHLPSVSVYGRLVLNELLFFNALHPQVYVIPGGALWLLRFPRP